MKVHDFHTVRFYLKVRQSLELFPLVENMFCLSEAKVVAHGCMIGDNLFKYRYNLFKVIKSGKSIEIIHSKYETFYSEKCYYRMIMCLYIMCYVVEAIWGR